MHGRFFVSVLVTARLIGVLLGLFEMHSGDAMTAGASATAVVTAAAKSASSTVVVGRTQGD